VTVPLRLTSEAACAACRGTGAKAGTTPRVCPTCQGTGQTSRNAGGFAFAEPCRDCRGRGLDRRRPVPGLPRQRSRPVDADDPGAHPGRGQGRPADPAQGQGRAGRARRPERRPAHRGARVAAPALRPQGRQPHLTVPVTFPEAALGAEVKVPTLGGQPVTLKIPAGHHDRTYLPGPRQGRDPQGRDQGRPARHRRRRRAAEARRQGPRGARGVP
jgi:molecular chaperone DnaJ